MATPADDIEAELFKFLPANYTKSTVAFDKTVDEDATNFKPMGELIGSYTQRASSSKGKGKANGLEPSAAAADADAVTYEMFKVSLYLQQGDTLTPVFLGHARVPRVPSPNADLYPAVHRRWELYPGGRGSLGVYHLVSHTTPGPADIQV